MPLPGEEEDNGKVRVVQFVLLLNNCFLSRYTQDVTANIVLMVLTVKCVNRCLTMLHMSEAIPLMLVFVKVSIALKCCKHRHTSPQQDVSALVMLIAVHTIVILEWVCVTVPITHKV